MDDLTSNFDVTSVCRCFLHKCVLQHVTALADQLLSCVEQPVHVLVDIEFFV